MGNLCARPSTLSSPRSPLGNYVVFTETDGTQQGRYAAPTPSVRPVQIPPPSAAPAPAQPGQNTPTATTTTGTSSGTRNPAAQQSQEAQQPLKQPTQAAADPSEYAGNEEDGFAGPDVEPAAPFSWQRGRQIGQGAFGTVYMALVHATGQEIAVKQVSLPRDAASNGKVSGHIRSLEREVAVLRSLRHENIVRYLGTERTDEHLNIFLEYVAGGPISSKLAQFGPLREETIRVYTKQILRGLEYLHQQKVMHRDIKGANILVDTNGVVKLADFGASKKIEHLATIGGGSRSMHGTAHWMAPEVIKQLGHGRAADIWSLACVVIEMATGQPPWANFRDPLAVMFHVASTKELPAMPESLSAHARDFLTLCFNRVPHERPNATRLLQHPWLQGVTVPRSNRAAAATIPAPLPLPSAQQQQAQPQQQQQLLIPGAPSHAFLHMQQQQPVPPPPGLRSPPSPIKEEPDSRFGSPAVCAPDIGSPTPTAGVSLAPAGFSGPTPVGQRPMIPPLPLDAMKTGTLPSMASGPGPSSGRMPTSSHNHGAASAAPAPPRPPLPPSLQAATKGNNAAIAVTTQNQQYDSIADPDAVRLQLQNLQYQYQQHQQPVPGPSVSDSICMGVGMTISMPAPASEAAAGGLPLASYMTLSGFNPIEEPSWAPQQLIANQAILQQLAAITEHSAPHSPAGSCGGAAAPATSTTTTAAALAPAPAADTRSTGSSSAGCPDVPSSSCHADTAKLLTAPSSDLYGTLVSPCSGAGTQRSGAGTHRGTVRSKGVPSRPALAGLFAAAGEEEGDTQVEPDQPSPAARSNPAGGAIASAFSPNATPKLQVRQSAAQAGTRSRVSASRRALEEAGVLGGTLDPARAKQWRDELEAELEAERLRAAAGTVPPRDSVATAPTMPYAAASSGSRPSVADLF